MAGQSSNVSSSVGALVDAGLPDSGGAHFSDIDVVLAARSVDKDGWTPAQRAGFSAAETRALVYSGHSVDAVKAADDGREYLREAAGNTDVGFLAKCHSALAEGYLLAGYGRSCAELARSAIDQANQAGNAVALVEGRGLMAAAMALNGEFDSAQLYSAQAAATAQGSAPEARPWYLTLSRGFIASDRGDRESLAALVSSQGNARGRASLDSAVASLVRAWEVLAGGDPRGAVAEIESFVSGVFIAGCPPLLRALAVRTEAEAFLQLGQSRNAARALAGLESLPDHSVCFEWLRAAAHLQRNEPREALRVTERCLRIASMHSPRTMPLVRVRRAVAFEMLGLHDLADREFSRAIHLCDALGWVTVVRGLAPETVEVLVQRLAVNESDFADRVKDQIREDLQHGVAPEQGISFVQLTDREKAIANLLPNDLSLGEIAATLHVSTNTVKTHLHHLYKKLGVSSRKEAQSRLLEAGLAKTPNRTDSTRVRGAGGEVG